MTNLTPSSWLKIALIALLCLVLCTGVGGCFVGIQRSVNAAMGNFVHHHGSVSNAASFPNSGNASFDTGEVRSITIDWLAGEVNVVATDDAACDGKIQVQETSRRRGNDVPEADRLRWSLDDGELVIAYMDGSASGWGNFGLFGCSADSKTLTVMVPLSYAHDLENVSIAGASGRYSLTGIGCDTLELDLASGEVGGVGLSAQTVDLNVASGKINLEGDFSDRLFLDIMSGNVGVTCTGTCPNAVDISVMSGVVQLRTPSESEHGYTVSVDKVAGSFTCPRATSHGGAYVVGDGKGAFAVDMTSGSVTID